MEKKIVEGLTSLADPQKFKMKYNLQGKQNVLLYAMGDGNHSLATAKAIWDKMKYSVGMVHPSRYALVELVNVHDTGLEFEPIHRVLFDVKGDIFEKIKSVFKENVKITKVTDPITDEGPYFEIDPGSTTNRRDQLNRQSCNGNC